MKKMEKVWVCPNEHKKEADWITPEVERMKNKPEKTWANITVIGCVSKFLHYDLWFL